MKLAGRVAIVTGASRGIGLGIARRFVDEGARVCLTARKPEALAEAVASLGGPEHAIGVPGRADDPEHRADAVRRATEAFGPVDVLVNNTGINPVFGPLVELDLAAARKILDVNVLAALGWVQQLCADGLPERGGAIVNVSSIAALRPAPGHLVLRRQQGGADPPDRQPRGRAGPDRTRQRGGARGGEDPVRGRAVRGARGGGAPPATRCGGWACRRTWPARWRSWPPPTPPGSPGRPWWSTAA